MSKRQLSIDWRTVNGANAVRKKLRLNGNEEAEYPCPVEQCIHRPFKSKRGCRKHVDTRHGWYYYFPTAPVLTPCERNTATDAMKFLMFSSGNNLDEMLTHTFIDCCVSSPSLISSFLEEIESKWKLKTSGSYNYLKAITDLMESTWCVRSYTKDVHSYRSVRSYTKDVHSYRSVRSYTKHVHSYSSVRSYTKDVHSYRSVLTKRDAQPFQVKICSNIGVWKMHWYSTLLHCYIVYLYRKKQAEWSRNYTLETLIAKNSWATIDEMENVLPYHSTKFKTTIERCRDRPSEVCLQDLVFAKRFITTFLFLKVKCTRSMSYQYLTIAMLEKAKSNGGYIDQTDFKTNGSYTFDTLIIDVDVLKIIDLYVLHCRPLLSPKCDYLLGTTSGNIC